MACPFARFSRQSIKVDTGAALDASTATAGEAESSRLTAQLKTGTWEAHREIEKSAGVRALMGSFHAEHSVRFDRFDHLALLIMLACVYITMEALLTKERSALDDMTPLLVRSRALLEDIQTHLDEILDTKDARISDLDRAVDEGAARELHERIQAVILPAQARLAEDRIEPSSSSQLTNDHIAILTTRQARAVVSYVEQISSLLHHPHNHQHDEGISLTPLQSPVSTSVADEKRAPVFSSSSALSNTLILAHAYVRYMGDLSGGQHIAKRLSKLFPIYHDDTASTTSPGFQFYSFTSTGKTSTEIKDMIRIRMDAIVMGKEEMQSVVDEASLAFRLNRSLLDSLVDEDSSQPIWSPPSTHPLASPQALLAIAGSCDSHHLALFATLFSVGIVLLAQFLYKSTPPVTL